MQQCPINYLPEEEDDAREVVDLIKKAGRNVLAIPGDIRDEAFCGHLVTQAVKGLGGLDIRHCCKVSDEAAFCLIQRPYISKTLL
ncbi:hypothetical protein ACTAK1_28600, partial [Klebsiella pneumoniae]